MTEPGKLIVLVRGCPDIRLVVAKGSERYLFGFSFARRFELMPVLDRFAADPRLSFTAFDAAQLRVVLRSLTDDDGDEGPHGGR